MHPWTGSSQAMGAHPSWELRPADGASSPRGTSSGQLTGSQLRECSGALDSSYALKVGALICHHNQLRGHIGLKGSDALLKLGVAANHVSRLGGTLAAVLKCGDAEYMRCCSTLECSD